MDSVKVIYQKEGVSEKLAKSLQPKIKKLMKHQGKNPNLLQLAPVYFVIVNRSYDYLTPLLRNYFYSGLFFDLLYKKQSVLEFESIENEKKVMKKSKLNEKDPLWLNYKYKNI